MKGIIRFGAAALILPLVVFGSLFVTVSGKQKDADGGTDSGYVLCFSADKGMDGSAPLYAYASPFMVDHTILDDEGNVSYSGKCFPEVFNLKSTVTQNHSYQPAGGTIAAYGADVRAETRENTSYRRINLEDSAFFSQKAAGKLRAIVQCSFPYCDIGALQEQANWWLAAEELPQIHQLQSGEAILAAQLAIWTQTNLENYEINAHYDGWQDMTTDAWRGYRKQVADQEAINQKPGEYTRQNIESLYAYLCGLEPLDPVHKAVSDFALKQPVYHGVLEEDGTYRVQVEITVEATIGSKDRVILSAQCQEQTQSQQITGAGTYSFTFTGLKERSEVSLEISGSQKGADVYLYDPEGDSGTSQALIAYDESVLPVYGSCTASPDRVIHIRLEGQDGDNDVEAQTVRYFLYKTTEAFQREVNSPYPSSEEIACFQRKENLAATLEGDYRGYASFNFTENGLPDGVYMIVPSGDSLSEEQKKPFYIEIPGTAWDGSVIYSLEVEIPDVSQNPPEIETKICGAGAYNSCDLGREYTWQISCGIPNGLGNALEYSILGDLDANLTYRADSFICRLHTAQGQVLTLQEKEHYYIEENPLQNGNQTGAAWRLTLTKAGMTYVWENRGQGEADPKLVISYGAWMEYGAEMGSAIGNQSRLAYTGSAGIKHTAVSNKAEVCTGGIRLYAVNEQGEPLSGAALQIYRPAEKQDAEEQEKIQLLSLGDSQIQVVPAEFYGADGNGQPMTRIVTDDQGMAEIYGLSYGTYYLLEMQAPGGYDLLNEPVEITIDAYSHLTASHGWTDRQGNVVDRSILLKHGQDPLPQTGDTGINGVLLLGLGVGGGGLVLLLAIGVRKRNTSF